MKYRDLETYQCKDIKVHNRSVLKDCASMYNRSEAQCLWLYNLCGGFLHMYHTLELTIIEYNVFHCPNTREEVLTILSKVHYNKNK